MKRVCALLCPLVLAGGVLAQAGTQDELQQLRKQFQEFKRDTDEAIDELESRLAAGGAGAESGTTDFLLTGYTSANYTEVERSNSVFGGSFNPLFLWQLSDELFFESEVELELEDDETEVVLEYAHLTYSPFDFLSIGAGKFLVPFAQWGERLHPAWINKLPDGPLHWAHHGGLAPLSEVGLNVRGGFDVQDVGVNYALYVTNGPQLLTSGHHAGELRFGFAGDNNTNKALGGRIGVLPIPQLEVGFSMMGGRAGTNGDPTSQVDALLWALDASYTRTWDQIKGTVDARFEFMRSDVDQDPSLIGGLDNERDGLYVQLAYRPDQLENFAKNLEGVFRFDDVDQPGSGADRSRLTFGINYWLGPSSLGKVAYQVDDRDGPGDANALLIQFAMGF